MPDRDLKHRKPYAYKKTRKVEGFLTEFAKGPAHFVFELYKPKQRSNICEERACCCNSATRPPAIAFQSLLSSRPLSRPSDNELVPRMIQRTGKAAKLPFPVHPHMLRDSTGYKLANDGHNTRSLAHYLGHRNLQSTARYTAR
jgi:site-specific recombinase XerD